MTDRPLIEGTLTWNKRGQPLLSWVNAKGNRTTRTAPSGSLDPVLRSAPSQTVDVRIQLDERGNPVRVVPAEVTHRPTAPPSSPPPPPRTGRRTEARQGGSTDEARPGRRPDFINPYNFIPTPPRNLSDVTMGDRDPRERGLHDRFPNDLLSGRICLRIECRSPLLLLDSAARRGSPDHWTYPLRLDPDYDDGRPLLAASAVKGMLRSAFEAITNSRYGVFGPHDRRLGRRRPAERGASVVPVRIEQSGQARLLRGTTAAGQRGGFLHAAWISMYGPGGPTTYQSGGSLQNRQHAWAWLRPVLREKRLRDRTVHLRLWRVVEIDDDGSRLSPQRCPQGPGIPHERYLADRPPIKTPGWVCLTHQNIGGKHDERFFFEDPISFPEEELIDVPEPVRAQWSELIADAVEANEGRMKRRHARGLTPAKYENTTEPALSWHLVDDHAAELLPGTLAYAELTSDGQSITALYPVTISRTLHEVTPATLLPPSLAPATEFNMLSPADRVFGWANQAGEGAWAGLARVGRVRCVTKDPIRSFNDGLPMAILGAPKPQQGRFYLARDEAGAPVQDRIGDAGYINGRWLRGRKVYPHHANLDQAFWNRDPMAVEELKRAPNLEYRRPRDERDQEQRDTQNRTVDGWVKPGTMFEFDLWFENLSLDELGGLLWLASLDDNCCLRLGLGRPLGFGSVHLSVRDLEVETGEQRAAWYRDLAAPAPEPVIDLCNGSARSDLCALMGSLALASARQAFQEAAMRAYGGGFEDLPFIAGFLAAARGDARYPVHYPRSTRAPHWAGENYRWFVANERGLKWALPSILDDNAALPIQGDEPSASRGEDGTRGRRRRPSR